MTTLYVDIETAPPPLGISEGLALDKQPPANYRDPKKIEAFRRANAGKGWRRLSLDVFRAEVLCVGWAIDDEPVTVSTLSEFAGSAMRVNLDAVVAANGFGFDWPILWAALVRLGDYATAREVAAWFTGKPWDVVAVDVLKACESWGVYGKSAPSLDILCRLFSVPSPKDGIDGSQVLDTWLSGEEGRQTVRDYCARDVDALREVHVRLKATGRVSR